MFTKVDHTWQRVV